MARKQIQGWLARHVRLLSYGAGSLLVTLWTVLRFFTARTIFDLVGQQVLAGQWLNGHIAGSGIGVTNYIPKIILLYMPLQALPGSPRLKLLILTVLVNIATLVLVGLILERLLRALGVKVGGALYGSVIWLGAVAGSVFWVQFTNSRNLEVVGGLFLVYQSIRYLQTAGNRRLAGIAAFCVLLFFADSLQLYMTALPVLLYGMLSLSKVHRVARVSRLALAMAAGYAGSKVIFWLLAHIFSIQFLQAGSQVHLSVHFLGQGGVGTLKALVHLYAGGADTGKLREIGNVLFLAISGAALIYGLHRKLVPRSVVLLVSSVFLTDIAVYIVSGQAEQGGTERYLIMTVPALLLLLGSLQPMWMRFRQAGAVIISVLFVCNGLFLAHALAQTNHSFNQDQHLASAHRYVHAHPDLLIYASMDTALPTAYLYDSSDQAPLPVACTPSGLHKTNTFYSKETYAERERQRHVGTAILLDGTGITNTPEHCNESQIIAQLGQPTATGHTDDGSLVLQYSPGFLKQLRY